MLLFQVFRSRDGSGTGKKGEYRYRELEGVLSLPDGQLRAGSIIFFERPDRPLPQVEQGKKYEVLTDVFVRDGRIEIRISGLRSVVAKAAAVP
jgi:hypothetical protein